MFPKWLTECQASLLNQLLRNEILPLRVSFHSIEKNTNSAAKLSDEDT